MRKDDNEMPLPSAFSREYFLRHNTGYQHYGVDVDIRRHTLMFRTLSLCPSPVIGSICDLAGGRGELSRHLADCGARVTYLDFSEDACDLARAQDNGRGIRYINADARRFGEFFGDGSLDLVIANQCIQYFPDEDLAALLAAIRAALAPNGSVCLNVPERTFGTILTRSGVDGFAVKHRDRPDLERLMAIFPSHGAFTWDGCEKFSQLGKHINLFGWGLNGEVQEFELPGIEMEIESHGEWVSDVKMLPYPVGGNLFIEADFDGSSKVPTGVNMQLLLNVKDGGPRSFAWTSIPSSKLDGDPHSLLVPRAAMALSDQSARNAEFDELVFRAMLTEANEPTKIRLSNLRVWHVR